ncbi:hypothetical protein RB2654_01065 [Rhodobacterales bacterium HTCC2654]|uniref:Uncharacterized protein n=1 Tax=Maritimibacter alkaliphilus HTCC2654 TaxID=314271 RepID=A3VI50_9RHOB|nr:hypothetical protein RB2654_01065 [Rhodobacterales bacterium HTCC2654] [Maritimibacter alkaliphilus HTCC2654]
MSGPAPCQCFSPASKRTTSPGRMISTGPPARWARPTPCVTTMVWPAGWVCHAVRAPGSKVTSVPPARPGSSAVKSGSMRTRPVNQSAGPMRDGVSPARVIFMGASVAFARSVPRRAPAGNRRPTCFCGVAVRAAAQDCVATSGGETP